MTDGAGLVGRESELRQLLAAVAPGSGHRLRLTAPPGMGKTTLLDVFFEAAAALDLTVLRVRPTEVDQQLAFSALSDLLGDVDPVAFDALPDPQRRALRVALLLDDPDTDVDPRAVAAAARTLLDNLAQRRAVLVVLDDAQWLDQASAAVLSHALRRLEEDRVHVVAFGRREPWPLVLDDARTLELAPLGPVALFQLVKEHLGLALNRARLVALETSSGGNPLYALEIVRRQVGTGQAHTLDELIGARVRELTPTTRRSLLCAALAASPTLDVLAAANAQTPEDLLADLESARASGLVRVTDGVAFSHPLYAQAVVEESAGPEIRDAHRRLAPVEPEPEARVRHLGAAAAGPDRMLADRLGDAAASARQRGAWASAMELLRRSAELTPDDDDRSLRFAQLGEWLTVAGRSAEAEEVFTLLRQTTSGPAYWRAAIGLGRLWSTEGRERQDLASVLSEVMEADAPAELRAEAHLVLGDNDDRADVNVARAVSLLEPLPRSPAVDRLMSAALVTWSWLRAEKGEPFADLLARAAQLQRDTPPGRVGDSAQFVIGQQALFNDRYDEGRAIFSGLLRQCEDMGDDYSLPAVLANLAHLEYRAGRWDDALDLVLEGRRISEGQRQVFWQLTGAQLMLLTGLRGDREGALAEVDALRTGDLTTTDPVYLAIVDGAVGRVQLAHGDAAAAFETLSRAIALAESVGWSDPGQMSLDTAYLEAAIQTGHLAEAQARLGLVERRADHAQRAAVLLGCRHARLSLLAARGDIEAVVYELQALLAAFDVGPSQPLERAHAYLFAGRIYRRARKKRMAHDAICAALAAYEQIGCTPYVAQARAELARVGLRPGAPDALTASERRVAGLAADGLRNKEIAGQLFMSTKTVEATLSRAYRKLGVRARTDLAQALGD